MNAVSFFYEHKLPLFAFLSSESKQVVEDYLSGGNQRFRQQQLLEFFKALDWMPLEEIPINPLKKLSPSHQGQLHREIQRYLSDKADSRQKSAERRKIHTLNVFEYFRATVPREDKALLESLRDYELNRTGRDVNWQHYFRLKSYKKVDEFVNLSPVERKERIEAFKADVTTYLRNMEKLRHQADCLTGARPLFNFDDWCDWVSTQDPQQQTGPRNHRQKTEDKSSPPLTPLRRAYRCLDLAENASLPEVKKQFRQLTLLHHPDMPNGDPERMKELISAYEAIRAHCMQA